LDRIRFLLTSWRLPLLAALAAFAGLAATGVAAHVLPAARAGDADGLAGFSALEDRSWLAALAERIAHLADPPQYALIGGTLVLLALARRRPRTALAVAVLLVATGLTTRGLKPLVDSPRYGLSGEREIFASSWPSGHATAAMTLALCAVLAAPAVLRPLVAVAGAAFAAAVSYAILVLAWHLPSDVIGGFLVAAGWTLLGVAALTAAEARWPVARPARRPVSPLAWRAAQVLSAAALAAAAAAAVTLAARTQFAVQHTTSVLGGMAIATLAAALALFLVRAIRAARTA
jgi:membrane-associated phospholipid phosphatase